MRVNQGPKKISVLPTELCLILDKSLQHLTTCSYWFMILSLKAASKQPQSSSEVKIVGVGGRHAANVYPWDWTGEGHVVLRVRESHNGTQQTSAACRTDSLVTLKLSVVQAARLPKDEKLELLRRIKRTLKGQLNDDQKLWKHDQIISTFIKFASTTLWKQFGRKRQTEMS